ncbi:MAG: Heparinase II/III-like [Devosia sp.]|nr:Heparinase II/III-like [Devosia sp.]
MREQLGFMMRRAAFGAAEVVVTLPVVRWTWAGLSDDKFTAPLAEIRPSDRDTVREMMAGRYLLAARLVDTGGTSPFAIETQHADWRDELLSFSWLRHFRDARDEGERSLARMLALDWIGREGHFQRRSWAPALCATRVMNWLRHYTLLTDGAPAEQAQRILKVLGRQIQSLKLRGNLTRRPLDAMLTATALLAVALCDELEHKDTERRFAALLHELDTQLDADGLHLSRSPALHLEILAELASLRLTLAARHEGLARDLESRLEPMYRALDALTLGTGELGYFQGTGQVPHDLLVTVQAQGIGRFGRTGQLGGYGVLRSGPAIVIADSGQAQKLAFAEAGHAGAMAFEFSFGNELVIANCGPAPAQLAERQRLFRLGAAHSAPTVNFESAAAIAERGPLTGQLRALGTPPQLIVNDDDCSIIIVEHGFERRFGVTLERRISLLGDGRTLVGQDRMGLSGKSTGESLTLRFHLAPGAEVIRDAADEVVRIRLGSGRKWTFLFEGARLRVEESVRQSAHFGLHRTQQLVLEAGISHGAEIAWILTQENG